ncbi:MAG: hypothetical protein Q7T70_11290 [Polaromonas sp.]|nr:hypothetical protein [Polaromonas sp.]
MIRTRTICPQEACLTAVSALDDLVLELIKASKLKLTPRFLDWVADEATPLVEQHVVDAFEHPEFASSLRKADHRLALAHWVRQWVCPRIVTQFSELAVHLPQFAAAAVVAAPVPTPILFTPAPAPAAPVLASKPRKAAGLGLAMPA